MRAPTIRGIALVEREPAKWALPDLETCTAEQLIAMAYTAAMEPTRYDAMVASPAHVQAILGLVLRFDATLEVTLAARSTQEVVITEMTKQLKQARDELRRQAESRASNCCWCADTDNDSIPPAMFHFEEM